ncbi:MAG: ferritin-like domain-containing protein [Gemmatimonadota bacterium]|nr:ferritin-like domain-containing protein [Gemmatimonadota bacterium]
MSTHREEKPKSFVITDADQLMRFTTRRAFVRMLGVGGAVVMMPGVFSACATAPAPGAMTDGGLMFDLRSDVGIFRLVHTLEQLEAAFYSAVVASPNFSAFFNAPERELFTDLRNVEIVHREFVRAALGSQAVPDVTGSINMGTLNAILASRDGIVGAARLFEHLGVSGLNGAGKYLQDARNLLLAGKFVSVEARHAAALRDIPGPTNAMASTAFAGDDIVDSNGMDVKLEAGVVLDRVSATNIVSNGAVTSRNITHAPSPRQGVPSANFFPTTP